MNKNINEDIKVAHCITFLTFPTRYLCYYILNITGKLSETILERIELQGFPTVKNIMNPLGLPV